MPERVLPVGVSDLDDAPTAALALLVAPCLVFSFDRALVEAGFGCADEWLSLTFLADELLGYDGTLLVAALAARAAGRRAWQAGRWFLRDLRPIDVGVGLTISVAVLMAAPRLAETLTAATERGARQLGRAATTVGSAVAQVAAEANRQRVALHAASVTPDLPFGVRERLARTLAITTDPVSTEALAAASQHSSATVDETLGSHPAFIRTPAGWQLGRRRLPRLRELPPPK